MERTRDTGLTVAVSVATWALGLAVPDYQMPPEVAAGVGAIIGPILEDVRNPSSGLCSVAEPIEGPMSVAASPSRPSQAARQ